MKQILILLSVLFIASSLPAQQLQYPVFYFSHKKPAYITTNDGETLKGTINKIKRKRGLITEIDFTTEKGGQVGLIADDIQFMYLPQSDFDKVNRLVDISNDATKWRNKELNANLLKEDYVYFEKATVTFKNKERVLLMQLLNPNFSKKVKVYHDPWASETASANVAGVKVVGGIARSYYVSIDDQKTYKLRKPDYKKQFLNMWGSCSDVKRTYDKVKWSELVEHITTFTDCGE